jgi:DNA-binding beta-propeller fold protein YncE
MRSSVKQHHSACVLLLACFVASLALSSAQSADPVSAPLVLVDRIALPQIMGGMNHLTADAARQRFFVTAPGGRKVVVVDLKGKKVLQVLAVPAAAATFLPDLDQLCVSGGQTVSFYEGASLTPLGTVALHSSLDELQYDAQEKRLYVGMMDANKPGLGIIDAPGRKLLHPIKLPAKPQAFVLEQSASRIYANTPLAKQVTVVDRKAQEIVAEWKLSDAQGNYPIALDEKTHRLFVGCRRPARLLVFDTGSCKTVASVDTGGDADDMSYDPVGKRVYLACGDGIISTIQQVDADQYQKLPDTPTAPGARNSLFVPQLKMFYVAVPRQGQMAAELRGYRAGE